MRLKAKTAMELSALAGAILLSLPTYNAASEPNDVPVTGAAPPVELRHLDKSAQELINRWNIPGAAIAVVKNGKVIFCRGYGYADVEARQPVDPQKSLFRVASISKTITAAAILKLVEDKKLGLDDKVFTILDDVQPAFAAHEDKRLSQISIRQLLEMSGGWDKERSGDPVLEPYIHRAAHRLRKLAPADFDMTMRYVIGHRLDFKPGSRFAYSNFEYGVLGKIVEKVSGSDYQTFVRTALFEPAGVQLYQGRTRKEDHLPNEVAYYAPLEPKFKPILPSPTRRVPAPYARAYMESDLPMFGWVSTAPDLAELVDKLTSDDSLLQAETRKLMVSRPALSCWQGKRKYFAMGVEVTDDGPGKVSVYKDGTLPGTRSFVQHTADGTTWVALFNARPPQKQPDKFARQVCDMMSNGLDYLASTKPTANAKPRFDYRKALREDKRRLERFFS